MMIQTKIRLSKMPSKKSCTSEPAAICARIASDEHHSSIGIRGKSRVTGGSTSAGGAADGAARASRADRGRRTGGAADCGAAGVRGDLAASLEDRRHDPKYRLAISIFFPAKFRKV